LSLDIGTFRRMLRERLDEELSAYLNACVRCGLCASSCHYYLTDGETASIPGYKLNRLGQVYRRSTGFPRLLPRREHEEALSRCCLRAVHDVRKVRLPLLNRA